MLLPSLWLFCIDISGFGKGNPSCSFWLMIRPICSKWLTWFVISIYTCVSCYVCCYSCRIPWIYIACAYSIGISVLNVHTCCYSCARCICSMFSIWTSCWTFYKYYCCSIWYVSMFGNWLKLLSPSCMIWSVCWSFICI